MSLREYLDQNMRRPLTERQLLEKCLRKGKKITECMGLVTEAMTPEQAKKAIPGMQKGLQTCKTKFKGDPAKIKACQARVQNIINKLKAKAGQK